MMWIAFWVLVIKVLRAMIELVPAGLVLDLALIKMTVAMIACLI